MLSLRLKELRKEKNLTQGQLAEISGLTTSCISMIETGQREANAHTVGALAVALRVSADYLLGLEDDFGNVVIKKEPTLPGGLSEKETRLLELFNSVSLFAQDGILYQLEALADKNKIKI